MQESRYNGDVILTGRATMKDLEVAFARPDNRAVALHKPGSRVERWVRGRRQVWEVLEDGTWQRVDRRDVTDTADHPGGTEPK